MANRYPLIVDTSDSNKIKELPSGDNLQLSGNDIVGVVNITGSGVLSIGTINATNINAGGTSLADVATSGSYNDLTDKPVNISTFTNDSNYVTSGSNISVFTNNAGYLTTIAFADITDKPTTLSGYAITDAATLAQGVKADTALQPADNISTLNNDAGYITLTQIQNGDISVDVNNTGDLIGSVFAQDSTALVDGILGAINLDGTIRGNVIPFQGDVWNIGSNSNKFNSAWFNGTLTTENITSAGVVNFSNARINFEDSQWQNIPGPLAVDVVGSVFADDSSIMVDAVSNKLNASEIDIIGSGNAFQVYDGGFNWVTTGNLNLVVGGIGGISSTGNFTINSSSGTVSITNAQVTGDLIGNVTGNTNGTHTGAVTGDVTGSVFADDSTLLVDGVNGEIPGYVKIADLKTALQDGAGDYAAFKAWVLANL